MQLKYLYLTQDNHITGDTIIFHQPSLDQFEQKFALFIALSFTYGEIEDILDIDLSDEDDVQTAIQREFESEDFLENQEFLNMAREQLHLNTETAICRFVDHIVASPKLLAVKIDDDIIKPFDQKNHLDFVAKNLNDQILQYIPEDERIEVIKHCHSDFTADNLPSDILDAFNNDKKLAQDFCDMILEFNSINGIFSQNLNMISQKRVYTSMSLMSRLIVQIKSHLTCYNQAAPFIDMYLDQFKQHHGDTNQLKQQSQIQKEVEDKIDVEDDAQHDVLQED